LSAEHRAGVLAHLWATLAAAPCNASVPTLRRLCLALAAATVMTPGACANYLTRVTSSAAEALGSSGQAVASASAPGNAPTSTVEVVWPLLVAAELLRALPEEAAAIHMSHDKVKAVRHDMQAGLAVVLQVLEALVATPASAVGIATAAAAAVQPAASTPGSGPALTLQALTSAFVCVHNWSDLGCTAGLLARERPHLLHAMLSALTGVPNASVTNAAAAAVEHVFRAGDGSAREAGRDEATHAAVGALVGGVHFIASTQAAGQCDLLRSFAVAAAAVGEVEFAWWSGPGASAPLPAHVSVQLSSFPHAMAAADEASAATIGQEAIGAGVLFGDLLLQCCGVSDRTVAEIGLETFVCVQTTHSMKRHPYFRAPIYRQLLHVLARQCMYPQTGYGSGGGAALDDFLAYRSGRSPVVDALGECFGVLRAEYATVLGAFLATQAAGADWRPLESALFCMRRVAPDVVDLLEEGDAGAQAVDSSLEETVVSLLLAATSLPAAQLAPEVTVSACRLLVGLRLWVSGVDLHGTLRYTPLPLVGQQAPHIGTGVDSRVDASFATLPCLQFVQALFTHLSRALQETSRAPGHAAPPTADTLATARAVAGTSARQPEGDDDDDGEDGGPAQAESGAAASSSVAASAALALSRLLIALRARIASEALVRSIADALEAAVAASPPLPLAHRARTLEALTMMTLQLQSDERDVCLHYVARPALSRLQGACACLPSDGAPVPPAVELQLACEVALLTVILRCGQADTSPDGGAPSPLEFVMQAAWPFADVAVRRCHERGDTVACVTSLLQESVRVCPSLAAARFSDVCSLAAQLYDAHLYPSALALVESVVLALQAQALRAQDASQGRDPLGDSWQLAAGAHSVPLAGLGRASSLSSISSTEGAAATLAPDAAAACAAVLDSVSVTTARACSAQSPSGGTMLANHPDAAVQYYKLCGTVLGACPEAVLSTGSLAVSLQVLGPALQSFNAPVAKAAASFVIRLLVPAGSTAVAALQPNVDACIAAHGDALVRGLVGALVHDSASAMSQHLVLMLQACMRVYGGRGMPEMIAAAVEEAAADATRAAVAEAQASASAAEWMSSRLAEGLPLEEDTSLLCLSPAERSGLVAMATHLSATAPHKFSMLLADFGKLCRRELTKDAFVGYLMPPDSRSP
jgi:hypothetical protein